MLADTREISSHSISDHLFLGIGAAKAGTTWLYRQLARHREIAFSPEKEIHYFAHRMGIQSPLDFDKRIRRVKAVISNLKDTSAPQDVRRKLDWYTNFYLADPVNDTWFANLFGGEQRRYRADFSNLNALLDDEGWALVRRSANRLKVIYTLRHPVERLWSHVKFHLAFTGKSNLLATWSPRQFSEFIARPMLADHADYAGVIRTLRRNLRADEFRIYFFEDFRKEPLAMLRDIEAFLSIGSLRYDEGILAQKVNVSSDLALPDFFRSFTQDTLTRQVTELKGLGYDPGGRWE